MAMPGIPVPVMVEGDLVRLLLARDALRGEHNGEPMLERPHVTLDLAFGLRGRGDEVQDAERPADPPEPGLEVLTLTAEHREPVGVYRLRNADVREHLLKRGIVLHQRLALADAACEDVPRRVVLADDDRLPRVPRPPQVKRRRVVLDELPEPALLPPAILRLLPALDRKELVQKLVEVPLAVLADVRAVAPEAVQPVKLVGVERVVGTVLSGRLEHLRQVLDAFARPGFGMVAAGQAEPNRLPFPSRQPLGAKTIKLRPGKLQRIHRHCRRDLAIVPFPKHTGNRLGAYPFVYLLFVHCRWNYPTSTNAKTASKTVSEAQKVVERAK